MAEKLVDLDGNLAELLERYPELIETLYGLGFLGVKNPVMRQTHAKEMTLRAGCAQLGVDPARLKAALEAAGFSLK